MLTEANLEADSDRVFIRRFTALVQASCARVQANLHAYCSIQNGLQ